jgi:alcohol dehydrogenase class IV
MAPSASALRRRELAASTLAAAAALVLIAKRSYPKAALVWLAKRLVAFILGRVLPIPTPQVTSGLGSLGKVGGLVRERGCRKALVVTDEMLVKHGLVQKCLDSLMAAGLDFEVFDKVVPNPPSELVEQGFERYKACSCDCIIAFGGGSPMDTAKIIGAKVCNPRSVESYQGFFKATRAGLLSLPPFIAVPTTAGTGSETTVAAIITLKKQNKKIAIMDLGLVPHHAVLDPQILEKLPKHITAATGMDALTHAVESFVSGMATAHTQALSLSAIEKTFKHLQVSYENGSDMPARDGMLQASFEAGLAFTRANVGYVHAIAHQLGGMFHTPHGDANAMLLPHVLDFYLAAEASGKGACTDLFCRMAVAAGLAKSLPREAKSRRLLAETFVARIRDMNASMSIPSEVKCMEAVHVKEVASRALREAHGQLHSCLRKPADWLFDLGYQPPRYMTQEDCERIVAQILPTAQRSAWEASA